MGFAREGSNPFLVDFFFLLKLHLNICCRRNKISDSASIQFSEHGRKYIQVELRKLRKICFIFYSIKRKKNNKTKNIEIYLIFLMLLFALDNPYQHSNRANKITTTTTTKLVKTTQFLLLLLFLLFFIINNKNNNNNDNNNKIKIILLGLNLSKINNNRQHNNNNNNNNKMRELFSLRNFDLFLFFC